MTTLLHIDSSLDTRHSTTRRLSQEFVERWAKSHPQAKILRRDLGKEPPPTLSEAFVRAIRKPFEQCSAEEMEAWSISDKLSSEFLRADRYVIGVPMHIFTVPSPFKIYLEQIFHEERVFRVTADGYVGLLGGRRFLFFLAKGADYRAGGPLAEFDMLEPYLLKLLVFCGVATEDIVFVSINNTLSPSGADQADKDQAEQAILRLAETW